MGPLGDSTESLLGVRLESRSGKLVRSQKITSGDKRILSCGKHCQTMQIGDCFKDSDFAGDLEDSKSYIRWNIVHFLEVTRSFQLVGCVRNKLQFRTIQQNQKSFPWTQD